MPVQFIMIMRNRLTDQANSQVLTTELGSTNSQPNCSLFAIEMQQRKKSYVSITLFRYMLETQNIHSYCSRINPSQTFPFMKCMYARTIDTLPHFGSTNNYIDPSMFRPLLHPHHTIQASKQNKVENLADIMELKPNQ